LLIEEIKGLREDVQYLMMCQQTQGMDIEQARKGFEKCSTKEELLALEEKLKQEDIFLSTVSI